MRKAVIVVIVIILTAMSVAVGVGASSSAKPSGHQMDHYWTYKPGDIVWYSGMYQVVWKRMEALEPGTKTFHYLYQVAPEGSMVGDWVKESELNPANILTPQASRFEEPGEKFCPPDFKVPLPCFGSN